MAAEVERSQTIQFADPSQINEESQESSDVKPQTVNFDDNFQLMEAEYVEEDDNNNKNTESSKPSLQQTISFSQNNNENKSDNQIEEEDEIDEEDKEAEEARIREGQNNPFSIYYKKKDSGSENPEELSATSETSTKKSNKRKREERDDAERNSDDETLISLKKQKTSHDKDEVSSDIHFDVSDDEGRTEKKKKRKHKKEKKHKKDKKEKKEKKSKKKRAKKQDGSDVVDETSQDPEKFLETLRQLGADSDDEDDPEFAKKLEKKLENQRMLPMAKKVRVKKSEDTLVEGDGEPVEQEDEDWFLKDEVGSVVGDLPALPKIKQSPKKKQKRQQTALGGPTRKAEFEKDSVQARMLRDADVHIEPKIAERLDVAALLKKVSQRTKQIPTFHMNQEVPEDEDEDMEIEEEEVKSRHENDEEVLLEDSRSSNDLAAFVAKSSSRDTSSKYEAESDDEDVIAMVLPPGEDPETKAIHEILNRVPQATFHDPSMTQGAPTMSIMTESVVAPVDTMTAEHSATQVQVPSEASNDSTEEQKTEEQKAVLDILTNSNGPALHLHYTQTQFVHASDLPADSEDSSDKPDEIISEKSTAAPVAAPVAEKPVEEVVVDTKPVEQQQPATEAKEEESGSEEEKEYDSEADEDDADEDDLSMVEHGEVDSGDEENALSLHQRRMREEEDAEMRYISKITSGKWREDRERNLDIMDSDDEEEDEEETSKQSGDSKDRKHKKRSKKNKRKNPYADHALVDEKELIDDEEDEAKEEEEIQKLKERVHKRNYLTVSFKSNSFLEEDKSSQGLLKMIEKSQTQSQSMSLSYSQSAEVMHEIAQDFLPSESKSVLARSKKQLNRLASSFKPQTMYSSFIFNTNSRGSGGDSNGSDENTNPNTVSQSQDGTASNKTQSSGSKASRAKSVTKSKTSFFRVLEESSQQF